MKNIPVRQMQTPLSDSNFGGSFSIRNIGDLLAGEDMVQALHRHDYFYILAIKEGTGHHVIDFTPFEIHDHTVFFMRPGQVHQLTLKTGSQGFVMQFKSDFFYPNDKASGQILQLASTKKFCQLDSESFKKLFELLSYIFQEYTDKKEGYQEVIKANLGIFLLNLSDTEKMIKERQPASIHIPNNVLKSFHFCWKLISSAINKYLSMQKCFIFQPIS